MDIISNSYWEGLEYVGSAIIGRLIREARHHLQPGHPRTQLFECLQRINAQDTAVAKYEVLQLEYDWYSPILKEGADPVRRIPIIFDMMEKSAHPHKIDIEYPGGVAEAQATFLKLSVPQSGFSKDDLKRLLDMCKHFLLPRRQWDDVQNVCEWVLSPTGALSLARQHWWSMSMAYDYLRKVAIGTWTKLRRPR